MSTEHQLFALRHFIDRSRFQKQPLFAAFVEIEKAYDSVQHPLLWASLQRKGVHGKMLAAIQSLCSRGAMSMKVCGRAGATGTAQVGVRQGCSLSPTLFGLFFDDLHSQLQSDCPSAGIECRGHRIPSLFYAGDVALLSASAQGLSSCWIPCSRSVQPMASPSAFPKQRLWSLMGAIMIVPGRWLVNI